MTDTKSNLFFCLFFYHRDKSSLCGIGFWIIKNKCFGVGEFCAPLWANILQFKGCNTVLFAWTLSLICIYVFDGSLANNLGQEAATSDKQLSFLEGKEGWSRVCSSRLYTFVKLKKEQLNIPKLAVSADVNYINKKRKENSPNLMASQDLSVSRDL